MNYTKPAVLPAWGENNTTSADMVQPANGDIQAGWPLSATPPSRQWFNWILNFCANAVRYFMQRGLVDYDAAETYQANARIIGNDGNTYISLVNNNTGHTPSTSPTYWGRWGYTLAQINASQLTQPNIASGDASTKVANTNFVTTAINAATTAITTAYTTAVNNAITTAENYASGGSGYSLGTSGYIKLPTWLGGIIIQWVTGGAASTPESGLVNIAFPLAFPTQCYFCTAGTKVNNAAINVDAMFQVYTWTTANVYLWLNAFSSQTSGATYTPMIIAIGK